MNYDYLPYAQQRSVLWGLAWVSKDRDGKIRFHFRWGRFCILICSLCLLAWIGLGTLAYYHFKYRRDYAEARLSETLFLPFQWKSFQERRGAYYIKAAHEAIEREDFRSALHFLRNGLLRMPRDLVARQTLAELYEFMVLRPDLAVDLLIEGIPSLDPGQIEQKSDYMRLVFSTASRNKFDGKIVRAASSLLQPETSVGDTDLLALISYQKANSLRNLGESDRALEVLETHQLERFAEGTALKAQILWDQGREAGAIQWLLDRLFDYPQNQALYEKLIQLYREQDDPERARRYARLYLLQHPEHFAAHLEMIALTYTTSGRGSTQLVSLMEDYLGIFASNPQHLRSLAVLACHHGDTELVCKLLGNPVLPPQRNEILIDHLILIESFVRANQHSEALLRIERLEQSMVDEGGLPPEFLSILHSLRAAVFHATGNETELRREIDALLSSPVQRMDRFLATAHLFLELNAASVALRILEHSFQYHGQSPEIATAMVKATLMQQDALALTQALQSALDTRRLSNSLLASAYDLLASDRHLHLAHRDKLLERIESFFVNDYLFRQR